MSMLTTIAQRAAEKNLPVLLIGGHAVLAHGHQRTTFDIDFVISVADRGTWTELLQSLGYSVFSERDAFSQFTAPEGSEMPVDLMVVNEATFGKLLAASLSIESIAANARAISLQHLLAMKYHALKHTNPNRTIKDLDDVIRLIEINRVDLEEPQWRELVLKHGTAELYEKLRRIARE